LPVLKSTTPDLATGYDGGVRWFLGVVVVAACHYAPPGATGGAPAADGNAADTRIDDAGVDVGGDGPDAATASCPGSYTADPTTGTAYRLVTDLVDWTTAETQCEADGAGIHLVVIEQPSEQLVVSAMIPADTATWIGITDRKVEATWAWVTPTNLAYEGWFPGQPNQNGVTDFDCGDWLASGGSEGWRDERCTPLKAYLCECDGVAADPSRF